MVYNNRHLPSVENFTYLGVNFSRNDSFTKGLKERSRQIYQSQSILDLHTLKHPSASASHIFELFDCLLKVLEKCTKNLIGYSRLAFNNHESNIDC